MKYILVSNDTDSIKFCKEDGSPMTDKEMSEILELMNSAVPEKIILEEDGYYDKFLVIKSKNYVTYDSSKEEGKQMVYRGSSIMDQKKEPRNKDFMMEIIHDIMFNESKGCKDILTKYIEEIHNMKDISRWCVKKTITKTLLTSTRKNETKVTDALDLDTVQEGDKVWLYNAIDGVIPDVDKEGVHKKDRKGNLKYKPNKILKTPEKWTGDHDVEHYMKRLIATLKILENVLDIKDLIEYCKEYDIQHK